MKRIIFKSWKRRKWSIGASVFFGLCLWAGLSGAFQGEDDTASGTEVAKLSQVLGRPTDHSITLNVLAPEDNEAYVEYGTAAGKYSAKTAATRSSTSAAPT